MNTYENGQQHFSRAPRMVRGVCAWLGERIDVDVSLVRLVAALALVISPITTLLVYFIAAWILKKNHAG